MLKIRVLQNNEFNYFLDACTYEGWDIDLTHTKCLFENYPEHFFIAYSDDNIVGYVLAIKESDEFGIVSNLLVLKEYRLQGYAKEILEFALKHLGNRQIAIDSVKGVEGLYEKFGFKSYYESSVFHFLTGKIKLPSSHINVSDVSLKDLLDYDKKHNSLKKHSYTSCLFNAEDTSYKAVYNNSDISSYALRLKYKDGYKIVISSNEINEAVTLFFSFLDGILDSTHIYMQIPETDKLQLALAELLEMTKLSSTTKMYNKVLK